MQRRREIGRVAALICAAIAFAALGVASLAWAAPIVSVQEDAACDDRFGWGVGGFHRAKRGSALELPDGRRIGYRYITGPRESVVLIAMPDAAVLYVPEGACQRAGLDLEDAGQVQALRELIGALDELHADGGAPLRSLDFVPEVTQERSVERGGWTFSFGVEAQGRFYAGVAPRRERMAASSTPTPLFCDYGSLLPASELGVAQGGGPLEEFAAFLARVDWSPLSVSLRTALAATLLVALIGIVAAWCTARLGARAKSVVDVLFLVPMVLPPTACGLVLLYLFGKNSPTGAWLIDAGIKVPFTWTAAVIAAVVVALPFMYRSARGAFESVDAGLIDAARTLGWSEGRIFAQLAIPLAAPSLAAGAVLSFSRALGEFGATVFFAGNYAGVTQTMPLAIYYNWMGGDAAAAWLWVVVTIVFSGAFLVSTQHLADGGRRWMPHGTVPGNECRDRARKRQKDRSFK